MDSGSLPFRPSTPKQYFRQLYYQECDLLIQELDKRFNETSQLQPLIDIETPLLKELPTENVFSNNWRL